MGFRKSLEQKKSVVVQKWFEQVIKTYPGDSALFLKSTKNTFDNPVGSSTMQSLESVFDELLKGMDHEALVSCMDPAIRIRAVQEFTPSQAISFVFFLKNIIREVLKNEINKDNIQQSDLDAFDHKIDELSLIAFDIYMRCREQIFKYRANHVKSRTLKLLEKADILCEVPEVGTEIIPHDVYKNGGFEDK